MGVIACLLLAAGYLTLRFAGAGESQTSMAASVCIRAGWILGALWLAFPQVTELSTSVSPLMVACLVVGGLIVIARPRAILLVGPVLAALFLLQLVGWLFKPLPPRQQPGRRPDKPDETQH
jgi:hypothetical protein